TRDLFRNFPRLDQEKSWDRIGGEGACESGGENAGREGQVEEALGKDALGEDALGENALGKSALGENALGKNALVVRNLYKTFYSRRGLFGKAHPVKAVQDVSFTVRPGEVLGLIGGSGSGKTTVSRLILGLEKLDSGEIFLDGEAIHDLRGAERRRAAKKIHLVFQDPYQSMRNTMSLFDIVAEPMIIQGGYSREEVQERVHAALKDVHLPQGERFLKRTPNQLSGGQRQRLSFARAVVARPRYIIADEPTSMLDVSLRQELLNLMEELRDRYQIGYIFITHDLSLAYHFCDRLLVMKEGVVVESAAARDLIHFPVHDYTRELISAVETPVLIPRISEELSSVYA
ncbi:MAG: ATP-binding cassette domain-containing protein, partial [Treponema sp.]|nr:ATP-binding cassette domain-containing protein [Treponema sp.]